MRVLASSSLMSGETIVPDLQPISRLALGAVFSESKKEFKLEESQVMSEGRANGVETSDWM